MTTFELFAGCGGLAKGVELAGFKHAGLLEINAQACESLRANFKPSLVHEADARTFDFSAYAGVDLVTGGPPCQPFSVGGLARGYDDTRDMFPQAARAVAEMGPRGFMFENVGGLLRPKFRAYFSYVLDRLRFPECAAWANEPWEKHAARLRSIAEGRVKYTGHRYKVDFHRFDAADYGVPQFRHRVFIVGLREDVQAEWTWPEPTTPDDAHRITLGEALEGVPDPRDPANDIPDNLFRDGARTYPGHTGSPLDAPSKTIKAGAHGVPGGENMIRFPDGSVRYMSVYEAKLVQTFPPDFVVTGAWGEALRQIGNAVPVRLAQIVARQMRRVLEADARSRRASR